MVGPNDDVLVPPGSARTDWEVELAVVIGRRARYLPNQSAAAACIAGHAVSNDVSGNGSLIWPHQERGGSVVC